jgi:membrane protease YdiL (CAAX protease family)
MSNVSSSLSEPVKQRTWNPWLGVVFVIIVYYVSQILSGVVISVFPGLKHWSQSQTVDWLNNSVGAQFAYILIAEGLAIGAVYLFLKRRGLGLASIGLKRPRWGDLGYGVAAVPAYFLLYLLSIGVVSHFVKGLNVDQQQQIGFNNVHGTWPLVMTFISLVVLPPLAEEIMVRGLLYSSLKGVVKLLPAVILTSAIFAAAHLPEGGAVGPLYIAALDTFVLSLVLIYLREKTGSLWASITLHAIKNGIAFVALFIIHVR